MAIQWKNAYSVGNMQLDMQHQKLFQLINSLEDSTRSLEFQDIAPMILSELKEYAHFHFRSEEEYLEAIHYPDKEAHIEIHEQLKKALDLEVEKQLSTQMTALSLMRLHHFLMHWINDHILVEDIKYGDYTRKDVDV